MKHLKLIFTLGILGDCVAYDQATKHIARAWVGYVSSFTHMLGFRYVENHNTLLSLDSGLPDELQTVFFGALLVVLFFTFIELIILTGRPHPITLGGLSMVVGGASSNLLDRLLNDGRVVDFIAVKAGAGLSCVCNYADLAIIAGSILLASRALCYPLSLKFKAAGNPPPRSEVPSTPFGANR